MYANCFPCTHSILMPVKNTGYYMYRQIKYPVFYSQKCIHIFRKVSRIKINYFPKRIQLAFLCNGDNVTCNMSP